MPIVTGIGVGLTISTLGSSSSAYLPPAMMAMGSALNATVRQVGAAMGFAIASALLTANIGSATMTGYRWAWLMIMSTSLLAALVWAPCTAARPTPSAAPPPTQVHGPLSVRRPPVLAPPHPHLVSRRAEPRGEPVVHVVVAESREPIEVDVASNSAGAASAQPGERVGVRVSLERAVVDTVTGS